MTTSIQPKPDTVPTPEQLTRAAARRRFNILFVYLPLAVAAIGVITLIVLMIIGVLSPMPETSRELVSGMADLIVILVIMPLVLVCGAVPLGLGGYLIHRRRQKPKAAQPTTAVPQYGRLQRLFWKAEDLLVKSRRKADELLPKIAQPVIRGNAFFAYLETWLLHLKQFFTRSNDGRQ